MKLRKEFSYLALQLVFLCCSSFVFAITPIDSDKISGIYSVEAYPESDGLSWQVELKRNGKGYQKSFHDGCSQSELRFIWAIENDQLTFSQTLIRERFSCEEKWSKWDDEFVDDEDPFEVEMLSSSEFILKSQLEEYQEKWVKIK
ncbi:MAG: hypothetical protein RIG68_22950 [Imperialibacter sp.]|uniref:hypothetical protein n=1 Tax=Imperialibacter sp. TaxID=2038411 RepID=UPI0032EEC3C0